jgi:phospholipid transport system substrate-binding protein
MVLRKLIQWSLSVAFCLTLGHSPLALAANDDGMEPASVTAQSPDAVIERTSDALLVLIEESRAYVKEDPERFYQAVEALLRPVVDFKGFARSVMAAHYKSANADQRERFAETFKWGLVRSYSLALTEFRDGEIALVASD